MSLKVVTVKNRGKKMIFMFVSYGLAVLSRADSSMYRSSDVHAQGR